MSEPASPDPVEAFLGGHPLADAPGSDAVVTEQLVAQRLFGGAPASVSQGRVELRRTLGAGGMGRVYLGHDVELRRDVAVKFLSAPIGERREGKEAKRLRREAQALAQIEHANVIRVYDVEHDEVMGLYLVMEYLPGTTMRTWIEGDRPPQSAMLRALGDCAEGLAAAHAAGIVHRDFKPENVLIGSDGTVKIADFGLARSHARDGEPPRVRLESTTTAASLAGTAAYMSPERLDGDPPDASNDVYAFCVTAWELLAARRPVSRTPPLAELARTPRLARALRRGLTPVGQRWRDMGPLIEVLRRELRPPAFRMPPAWIVGILVLAVLGLGFGLGRCTG
ncbi:MAG: serine/threonine-protein kinase [Myxococcota bacterium]